MESRKTVQMSLFAGQGSQRLTKKQRRDVWTRGGSKRRVSGAGIGLTHMCPTLRKGGRVGSCPTAEENSGSLVPRDALEAWEGGWGRETHDGGDLCIQRAPHTVVVWRKLIHHCKASSSKKRPELIKHL